VTVTLSLPTHYDFLCRQYILLRAMYSENNVEACIYGNALWAEMAWVWDRMSFRQKCMVLA
jgi:hypothetical protein